MFLFGLKFVIYCGRVLGIFWLLLLLMFMLRILIIWVLNFFIKFKSILLILGLFWLMMVGLK